MSEQALLAESMPFVSPHFGGGGSGPKGRFHTLFVKNAGRHAALNVQLVLGTDVLVEFPIVGPEETKQKEWRGDDIAERLWRARTSGWVMSTRYSDPYGNRYEVEIQRFTAGEVVPETRVRTYLLTPDGHRLRSLAEPLT